MVQKLREELTCRIIYLRWGGTTPWTHCGLAAPTKLILYNEVFHAWDGKWNTRCGRVAKG